MSCLVLLSAGPLLAAPNMTAQLDRNVVSVGESVTFTLTFEDMSPPGAPNLPTIPNVQFGGVSSRTEFQMFNQQRTTKTSYDYTLVPSQPGEYTIPSIQAQAQGQVYRTHPIKFKVVAGAAPGGTDPTIGKLAFLQMQIPKNQVYVGEVFPVDILIYFIAAREYQPPQIENEGFTVGGIIRAGQTRTMRDGQVYNVLVLKTSATAIRPGQQRLGPVRLQISIPKPGSRRNTIFGDFFGDYEYRQVVIRAEAQSVNVLPLPAQNIPPDFNGIVGSYSMKAEAGPTKLAVGDPITLKVQISGRGFLEGLNLPAQADWKDFKFYPATGKVESNDPLGLAGVKSFEQVVIPQSSDIKLLPSFRFSFFDPEVKTYRTLSNAPVALEVAATASSTPPVLTNATAGQNAPPVNDIMFIKSHWEDVAMLRPPLFTRPWFLGLQSVPLLAWLSLLLARKRKEALANNPRLRRQREVEKRIREGLASLRKYAESQDAEQFFGTLFRLLQEQLGERLDLPASAITEAVIDEHLRPRNLAGDTLDELRKLFNICNQFRYAPMKSKQELASLIPKLESVLQQLQGWEGVTR